jgi:hypothetical protein
MRSPIIITKPLQFEIDELTRRVDERHNDELLDA